MEIVRSEAEINRVIGGCKALTIIKASAQPDLSFEQGVVAALLWLTGNETPYGVFMVSDDSNYEQKVAKENVNFDAILFEQIEILEMPIKIMNRLKGAGIQYLGDLIQQNFNTLKIRSFSVPDIRHITMALERHSLFLEIKLDNWPPETLEYK